MAQTHYTSASISQFQNCFELFDFDKRKADQLSLCMAPWASRSISTQMSVAGRLLLTERNERLKGVTDPDQIQQIYFETRLKAEAIEYGVVGA